MPRVDILSETDRADVYQTVDALTPASGVDSVTHAALLNLFAAVVERAKRDAAGRLFQVKKEDRWAVQREAAAFLADGCGLIGDYARRFHVPNSAQRRRLNAKRLA